jgi:hypothetical protein
MLAVCHISAHVTSVWTCAQGAAGSSPEQPGAAGSSQELPGKVRSSKEQARGSQAQPSTCARSECERVGCIRRRSHVRHLCTHASTDACAQDADTCAPRVHADSDTRTRRFAYVLFEVCVSFVDRVYAFVVVFLHVFRWLKLRWPCVIRRLRNRSFMQS